MEENKDSYLLDISKKHLVKSTFYITYALLFTTGAICLIEALTTKDEKIRHIMNVETAISFIAGYFYSVFVSKIKEDMVELKEISRIRYVDWSITTPFMILSLGLVLTYNNKTNFNFYHFILFLLLNWSMLASGYAGETNRISKRKSQIIGFICFFVLFYAIYYLYIQPNPTLENLIPFGIYFIIWTMYGVAYELKEDMKNIMYNILDLFAKCFVGIGFWAYLVNLFTK